MPSSENVRITIDVDDTPLLVGLLATLESVDCQFWACEGPTLEPVDMVTCHVCTQIAQLRARLGQ